MHKAGQKNNKKTNKHGYVSSINNQNTGEP